PDIVPGVLVVEESCTGVGQRRARIMRATPVGAAGERYRDKRHCKEHSFPELSHDVSSRPLAAWRRHRSLSSKVAGDRNQGCHKIDRHERALGGTHCATPSTHCAAPRAAITALASAGAAAGAGGPGVAA